MDGVRISDYLGRACVIPPADPMVRVHPSLQHRWRSLQTVRNELNGARLPLPLRFLSALVFGGVFAFLMWIAVHRFLSAQDAANSAPILVGFVGLFGAGCGWGLCLRVRNPSRKLSAVRFCELIDHAQMCVACGFDLQGAPSGYDGCVRCPECGASWMLPSRVHRSRADQWLRNWSKPSPLGRHTPAEPI